MYYLYFQPWKVFTISDRDFFLSCRFYLIGSGPVVQFRAAWMETFGMEGGKKSGVTHEKGHEPDSNVSCNKAALLFSKG